MYGSYQRQTTNPSRSPIREFPTPHANAQDLPPLPILFTAVSAPELMYPPAQCLRLEMPWLKISVQLFCRCLFPPSFSIPVMPVWCRTELLLAGFSWPAVPTGAHLDGSACGQSGDEPAVHVAISQRLLLFFRYLDPHVSQVTHEQ